MSLYDSEPKVACSNCKGEFPESKSATHEAYCIRNIRKCPDCAMFVDKNELAEHRSEFHTKLSCDKCGAPVANAAALVKHTDSECRLRPKTCRYCDVKIPSQEFESHQQACGSRTKVCGLCNKNILVRDYEHHMDTCLGPPVEPALPQKRSSIVPSSTSVAEKNKESSQKQSSSASSNIPLNRQPSSSSTTQGINVVPSSIRPSVANPQRPSIASSSNRTAASQQQQQPLLEREIPTSEQRRPQSKQGNGGQQVPSSSSRPSGIASNQQRQPISGSSSSSNSTAATSQRDARLAELNDLPTQGYYDNLQTKKFSNFEKQELQQRSNVPSSTTSTASTTANNSSNGSRPVPVRPTDPRLAQQQLNQRPSMQSNTNMTSKQQQQQPVSQTNNTMGLQGNPSSSKQVHNDILSQAAAGRLPSSYGSTASNNQAQFAPSGVKTPVLPSINNSSNVNYRPTSRGGALQAASANALNNIPSQKGVMPQSPPIGRLGTANSKNQPSQSAFEDEDEDLQRAIQESMRRDLHMNKKQTSSNSSNNTNMGYRR